MNETQLRQYQNLNPLANAPNAVAHAMRLRVERRGLHNLMFRRPKAVSVALMPIVPDLKPEDHLDPEALAPTGFAFAMPLNYWLIILRRDGQVVRLNCGLLAWAFAISTVYGYALVREAMQA